jgi:hypothetical protein
MKKDIMSSIYRQSNLRLYTDWHRMCKTCKDEIKSQVRTWERVSVGNTACLFCFYIYGNKHGKYVILKK